jgi:hypothetical protein
MSLCLVSSENITALPVANMRDVTACARAFADAVENGEITVERCIVVAIVNGGLDYSAWGQTPTLIEATGLLELASRKIEREVE